MIHTQIDPYAELGVSPGAEPEAIAAAFKALALKYHPDRNPIGEGRMKALNEAFAILSDPAKRREYDSGHATSPAERPRWTPPPPPPPSPEPRKAAESCRFHPGAPATDQCSSCGRPVCAVCLDVRRRLGGGKVCTSCRSGELQVRLGLFLGLLAAGALVWRFGAHSSLLGSVILAYPGAAIPTGLRLLRRLRNSPLSSLLAIQPESLRWRAVKAGVLSVAVVIAGCVTAPVIMTSSAVLLAVELRAGHRTDRSWRRVIGARWSQLRERWARIRRGEWGTRG